MGAIAGKFAGDRYTHMRRGGHFAAHEEPDLLAADITAFFRQVAGA